MFSKKIVLLLLPSPTRIFTIPKFYHLKQSPTQTTHFPDFLLTFFCHNFIFYNNKVLIQGTGFRVKEMDFLRPFFRLLGFVEPFLILAQSLLYQGFPDFTSHLFSEIKRMGFLFPPFFPAFDSCLYPHIFHRHIRTLF